MYVGVGACVCARVWQWPVMWYPDRGPCGLSTFVWWPEFVFVGRCCWSVCVLDLQRVFRGMATAAVLRGTVLSGFLHKKGIVQLPPTVWSKKRLWQPTPQPNRQRCPEACAQKVEGKPTAGCSPARARALLEGEGVIGAVPERLQSGRRDVKAVGGWAVTGGWKCGWGWCWGMGIPLGESKGSGGGGGRPPRFKRFPAEGIPEQAADGQDDCSHHCVPTHRTAPQYKNSDKELKRPTFPTENARLLSESAAVALEGGGLQGGSRDR